MTALVFNCNYNGLSIIQELGRRGINVFALDSYRSIGTYSRYATYWKCPDPAIEEDSFIDFLISQGKYFDHKPILFPTNDHWAMAISRNKEKLANLYKLCVADWPTFDLIIHKQQFNIWARTQGYPVPESWSYEQVNRIPNNAFPISAKPEYRRISSNCAQTLERFAKLDRRRLTVLKNRDELKRFMEQNSDLLPYFIFQEYVRGLSDQMYTVGIYANRSHQVIGLFTGRKLRGFPPDIGDCIFGQVETIPDKLIYITKTICDQLNYHGIAEFEFKRDSFTGDYKLIEINPRSWSWVGITPACNVSLPWIAYNDLIGIENAGHKYFSMPTGSVKWVRLLDDMSNCLYFNKQVGYPDWDMSFKEWRQSIKADKIVIAEFAKDDLFPGFVAIREFLKRILRWFLR